MLSFKFKPELVCSDPPPGSFKLSSNLSPGNSVQGFKKRNCQCQ
jgi:hypothetical protein